MTDKTTNQLYTNIDRDLDDLNNISITYNHITYFNKTAPNCFQLGAVCELYHELFCDRQFLYIAIASNNDITTINRDRANGKTTVIN